MISKNRILAWLLCLCFAWQPAYAQSILSSLLGGGSGVAVQNDVLGLSLGESAESNGLLSIELLEGETLLGVGLSGQDILLLGAPSEGQGQPIESLLPLLDVIGSDQVSVIEFLEDSTLSGDVEPTVLTVSLPGIELGNGAEPKTADTSRDRVDSAQPANEPLSREIILARDCQDNDGDSVCDALDQCPDSPPKAIVLPSGCHFAIDRPLELRGVEFAVETAVLTPSSTAILKRAAHILKGMEDIRIEVAGHTDDTGSEHYNLELSRQRAKAVRAFLVAEGVDPERLVARGYGASVPKVPVANLSGRSLAEARARNRRVELRLLQADQHSSK